MTLLVQQRNNGCWWRSFFEQNSATNNANRLQKRIVRLPLLSTCLKECGKSTDIVIHVLFPLSPRASDELSFYTGVLCHLCVGFLQMCERGDFWPLLAVLKVSVALPGTQRGKMLGGFSLIFGRQGRQAGLWRGGAISSTEVIWCQP